MNHPPDACGSADQHCITCGDDGIRMTVVALDDETAGCVDGDGGRHDVAIELVGGVAIGDELLVHAGVAIAQLEIALR